VRDQFSAQQLLPHADVALNYHLGLKPEEQLVIAWDETVSVHVYDAFRAVAALQHDQTTAVTYAPFAEHLIQEYGVFAGRSLKEPLNIPPVLLATLEAADAFVLLGSDTEILFSPDLKELLDKGKRGIFLPYHSAFNAYRMLFQTEEEARHQSELIRAVGQIVDQEAEVRVTSEEGTDLRFTIGRFRTLQRDGAVQSGQLQILPAGSIARVPDPGSVYGTLVVDRTVCADDYKELHEPIYLEVEANRVVSIHGGMEAKLLRTFLERLNDERAFNLTELGVGTNPLCKWSGIGAPSEDTHVQGTIAFALGCDTHLGGETDGPAHVDMTMRFPTLEIGGTTVTADGQLQITV